jgi:soluble lytic murein transglycosylase-like protein
VLSQFDTQISLASVKYNVPISWIKAFIQTESSGNPKAYRAEPKIDDGSYGLGQLLLKTARGLGFTGLPVELFDPTMNIDLTTKLIAQLRDKYGENISRVYSAYNSGRPDLYKTSSQVKTNVDHLLANFKLVLQSEPFILSMGVISVAITALTLWYYNR